MSRHRQQIDIGRRFARAVGIIPEDGVDYVEVTHIEAKPATLIQVEPASEDDWEIVVGKSSTTSTRS